MTYDDLNATELAELARREKGILSLHRGISRQDLVAILEGRLDPGDFPPDPLDVEREAMLRMQEEWPDVLNQLKCGSEFYACWDCPAARARCCAVDECEPNILDTVREAQDSG